MATVSYLHDRRDRPAGAARCGPAPLLVGFVILFGTVSSRGPLVAVLSSRLFAGDAQATIYGTVLLAMGVGGALAGWATGTARHHRWLPCRFRAVGAGRRRGLVTFRSIDTSHLPRPEKT
ncbi:MAG: hypothetical protein R3E68_22275 [Burkholderiaceae bacterium]